MATNETLAERQKAAWLEGLPLAPPEETPEALAWLFPTPPGEGEALADGED